MSKLATEDTLREGVDMLSMFVRHEMDYFNDYRTILDIVEAGLAEKYFNIGDQIPVTWNNGTTDYDDPWDVVDFRNVVNAKGNTVPAMILQQHWVLPGIQFDASEAIYVASEALPAATYNFTIGTTWGSNCTAGKVYQFTTTETIPAGGQVVVGRNNEFYTWGAPDQNPANWRVHTYSSNTSLTPLEQNLTLTEGSEGTSLGSLASNVKYGTSGINNLQRAAYGYNRWSMSGVRQYLNSDLAANAWWAPQHPFDRPPQQLSTTRGFMAGLPNDFLNIVAPIRITTALNTVSDSDIGTTEVTTDKFWLPSLEEEYCAPQLANVEGPYFEYWKERLGLNAPQASGGANANANHIRYLISNHTSAQHVRLRSAGRGSALSPWYVNAAGCVYSGYAAGAGALAPACAICSQK